MTINETISFQTVDFKTQDPVEPTQLTLKIADQNANYIVHRSYLANKKKNYIPTASSKTRSEVSGGGRKPWKQKGTGRARAGSNRSPLWRGGGVTFGPKPIKAKHKINKKEFRLALRTLFYNKRNLITVVNKYELETAKTQNLVQKLHELNINTNEKVLIIAKSKNDNLIKTSKNIKNTTLRNINNLNVSVLLKAKQIIIEKDALTEFKNLYQ